MFMQACLMACKGCEGCADGCAGIFEAWIQLVIMLLQSHGGNIIRLF